MLQKYASIALNVQIKKEGIVKRLKCGNALKEGRCDTPKMRKYIKKNETQ